jgi:hypothetical protein
MAGVFGMFRSQAAYFFIVVGLVWGAVGALTGSYLAAWPVVACLVAGVLVKLRPGYRLTWAWAISTASMGFLVSAYQVYSWASFLGGAFSSLAGESLAGFALFAVVHVFLFYAGVGRPKSLKSGSG